MEKWLKPLAFLATLIMFIVMVAGSLVTKTDSALGCGNDWPLCNGKWVPEYTLASIIEYSHRLITGVAGIVVVIFSVLCWRYYKGNQEVRNLAIFGLFFIVVESILGASAVIWPQSSSVLALHFGFSLLAYSGVFLLSVFVYQREKTQSLVKTTVSKGFRNWMWFVATYTYAVVYLGAYVRHTGSSMACSDWPLCQGQIIPELYGQTGIHFAHRIAAMVLGFLLLGTMLYCMRHFKEKRRDLYGASILSFILCIAQVFSGGFVIIYKLHLYATLTHSMIITILFGIISYMCLQTLKSPINEKLRR
ncbi:heme A synthase [Brevibacillus fortis]|uniref:Heme A synthase n=1 Tax=Brevibacillus fortis TaxID=2126352 RepID=A0A2P7UHV3_9BACL|nr:heme A synthase [Brevibacillus fortis]MED1781696.1 heme A synthase [Brevibacillus fortis]PSJ86576.1 heme A synthase [Brevibacillus fortis]